ncbi:hypothetical protein BpHYR1_008057 [Brachionus plicatilis]|uniref:Uncharacterized protein n=1 Tax=Brachionus plicatilis TaxID=10195 RepID=A0A3M7T3I7_BRAPC|nr:hypothetical protein BpHYR1_008057 [Brachionus plicatilis]
MFEFMPYKISMANHTFYNYPLFLFGQKSKQSHFDSLVLLVLTILEEKNSIKKEPTNVKFCAFFISH